MTAAVLLILCALAFAAALHLVSRDDRPAPRDPERTPPRHAPPDVDASAQRTSSTSTSARKAPRFEPVLPARPTQQSYEQVERPRMPAEIATAQLVTSEKTYRRRGERPFFAKVDQGFRTTDGRLVLVETKNRMRVSLADVVQLSAQSIALHSEVGDTLGRPCHYGYIRTQLLGGPPRYRAFQLYPESVIDQLVDRYQALRLHQRAPEIRPHPSRCGGCAFRLPCRAARLPSTTDAAREKLLQPMRLEARLRNGEA